MIVLVATAFAIDVRVPVPTQRLYDAPDRVCVHAPTTAPIPPTEMDDGRFRVTCGMDAGRARMCMVLLLDDWPARVAPFTCGSDPEYTLVPVPAFDPAEDIWDGVRIRADVSVNQAAFRAPDVAHAAGILPGGSCGISDHRFWYEAPKRPKVQTCTLILRDDGVEIERTVEIRQVARLPR